MSTTYDALKARDQRAVMNTYGRYPLAFASGKGCRLRDLDGREYLDLLSGIAVSTLGHGNEELAEVMARQARTLTHVSNLYLTEPQVELAERLTATFGDKAFFCNSGAEANEAAIKLARRYAQRVRESGAFEIVTLSGSFHGRTLATLTATGQDHVKDGFDPLPEGFVTVPLGDVAALEAAVGPHTAAVMIEVVQGEGGVNPLPRDYMTAVTRVCKASGALCIVDEVQTGLCRTGRFWAHQHFADVLEPDIVTTAKPLAGGLPMGAMLATDEAAKGFAPGSHATTFGGGPLVAAVACKVLEIMDRDGLAEHAAEVGGKALELFRGLRQRHPGLVTDVRGLGLMLAIELDGSDPERGKRVFDALMRAGCLVNLSKGRILRLLPPLVIETADLEAFTEALDGILSGLGS